jgi:putative ABC transport system permease protein
MTPFQILRVAVKALLVNKLRSFLTALGIIIGVAAVIAMVAIGDGARTEVEQAFAAIGSNMLVILPGTTTAGGARGGFGTLPTLTWDDLKAIQTELPAVRYAAAALRTTAQVQGDDANWTTSITGTSPEYLDIRDWPMAQGSRFLQSDVDGATKVALLGQTVADKLFGAGANPVGQIVRIRNVPFQVTGVLARKGQSPGGQDFDDTVIIPQTTFATKIQGGLQKYISGVILAAATSADATPRAEAEITSLLRDRHHIQPGADDDFSIRNLAEMASARQQSTDTLTALLASIALVSLVVGGIGIMNIMLVSVTERTREIGLRMAVGAKPWLILAQFLVEASALSVAGGAAGVALGLWAAADLARRFGWPMLVRPEIILIAVGFSACVGVGFGLYPAQRASRLDPIEALRYE